MAVVNHLNAGDIFGAGKDEYLYFRWGHNFAYQYNIGDRISWACVYRPPAADGQVCVPAYAAFRPYGTEGSFFQIVIEGDIIQGIEPISWVQFEADDELFENLMQLPNSPPS